MARSFSGSGQYLTQSSAVLTAPPLFFACWYKPASVSVFSTLIAISSQTVNGGFLMYVSNTGLLTANAKVAGVNNASTHGTAMVVGTWYLCVAVFASTTS